MNPLVVSVLDRTIAAGTPLLLATLGEILAERSGVQNLGMEGMMAVGAVSGFMAALHTGNPWIGVAAAMAAAAALALLHAFTAVILKVNQVVSGLAVAMLGTGIAGLIGKPYMGVPLPNQLPALRTPLLADIPVLGDILFDKDPLFYFSVVLGLALAFLLARTRWGMRVRSVGENPAAAAVQGVRVSRVRILCTLAGGALAGMGGAHLSLVYSKSWAEGLTGGRGWIVVALTIFTLWRPLRAFLGAFLFGGIFVLQYVLQPLGIPTNLLSMLPYAATLLVLVLGGLSRENRGRHEPAALGEPYMRGER